MDAKGLVEELASIEHTRWSDWQRWVHETCGPDSTHSGQGALLILPENVKRWERQIATSYAALSEREKQSDRDQVMRYWPLLVGYVANWLTFYDDIYPDYTIAQAWREEHEMTVTPPP